eukprot:TRINITY_DN16482_c0_g1_i4.p1 TRINITY_DN16482_c0_g1~~TRINITY_DN16482_c0_g1_i4.p1  ORF type:complete len:150 (-),score=14.94 TRINITY_DN16482_c0_g1_i4:191-640(-)
MCIRDSFWPNRTRQLTPNPDFFTTLLWQQLMGTRMLAVSGTDTPLVRVHASCARTGQPGDVTLSFSNGNPTPVQLPVSVNASSHTDFRLSTGEEGVLDSRLVRLNGKLLTSAASPLGGELVSGFNGTILVQGYSYGFSVLHGVRAPACM